MTQLALVEIAATPALTTRQSFALTLVQEAGKDGVYSEEIGAAWCAQRGKHGPDERCQFDGSNGQQVLRALARKGLVRERRPRGLPRYWEALKEPGAAVECRPLAEAGVLETRPGSLSAQDDGWDDLVAAGY